MKWLVSLMLFWVAIDVAGDGLFLDVVEFSVFFQCFSVFQYQADGWTPHGSGRRTLRLYEEQP